MTHPVHRRVQTPIGSHADPAHRSHHRGSGAAPTTPTRGVLATRRRDRTTTSPAAAAGRDASVRPDTAQRLALFVVRGPHLGAVFPLDPTQTLGRDRSADVALYDDAISRQHARVLVRDGCVFVEDLGSRNGTTIQGAGVRGTAPLEVGSYLGLGPVTMLKLRVVDDLELDALMALHESTLRDPLTRLYNRRYFDERLRTELSFAERHGAPLALLLVDIDHFKRVNDSHGHRAGDVVLQLVAATIQRIMRPEDVVARFGGEEFVVIARDASERNALIFAERIRKHVAEVAANWKGETVQVTVSVGVSATTGVRTTSSADALLEAADSALYEAKRQGRNQVRLCSPARAVPRTPSETH